jgi:hypothetical protein
VNEVDLPGFRSSFHGVEVAIDHNNDKVCLLKAVCQHDHLGQWANSRTNSEECNKTCMSQTIEMSEERERRKDEHDEADPNMTR